MPKKGDRIERINKDHKGIIKEFLRIKDNEKSEKITIIVDKLINYNMNQLLEKK